MAALGWTESDIAQLEARAFLAERENERLRAELHDAKSDALRLHRDKMMYLEKLLSLGVDPPKSE